MNRILTGLTVLLLTAASATATELTLAEHALPDVTISADNRQVTIDGYGPVGLGNGIQLCARTFCLPLADSADMRDIRYHSADSLALNRSVAPSDLSDLATADSIPYHQLVRSSAELDSIGRKPVLVTEAQWNGRRWAVVTVFPVTLGENHGLYLHRSVSISAENDELFTGPPVDGREMIEASRDTRPLNSSSGSPDYLIVTGAALEPAMQQLASYRRSLGYTVDLRLIEDITALYYGRDDAERLRTFLREYYLAGGDYVLLAGDETILPVRYAYHYSTSELPDPYELQVCDFYFAEVEADWDPDNDNIFGERHISIASDQPQLRVGRLPFNAAEEAAAYVDKLISYESNPGNGSYDYLERAFFYSSDQMRDLGVGGQHGAIAAVYPHSMYIDTSSGVEAAAGNDPAPSSPSAAATLDSLAGGFGIVNVLAHGRSDAFGVTTSQYNEWPKTYFITEEFGESHGTCGDLPKDNRTAFYYSLACDNGGFDQDQPPLDRIQPNLAQTLLSLDSAGAIAFVGYSRWGWVGSSYLLQVAYFESLFSNPGRPAVDAMNDSKQRYYYYRDLVYGQNFLGDPALRVWTTAPEPLELSLAVTGNELFAVARSGGAPAADCRILVSDDQGTVADGLTDSDGRLLIAAPINPDAEYAVAGIKDGYANGFTRVRTSIATDVNDDPSTLPNQFALAQNYPNPFNPSTTIQFTLPRRSQVRLSIFNLLGQEVARLCDDTYAAGSHQLEWNATDYSGAAAASGIYFYRLETPEYSESRKMLLIR